VKKLPKDFKSKDLYELFSSCGEIFSCKVDYTPMGSCKGRGYVQFTKKEDAAKAILMMNGKVLGGAEIEVLAFEPKEARTVNMASKSCIYVKYIPKELQDKELKPLFEQFGKVEKMALIEEESEKYGFVDYATVEDSKVAEEKLNGLILGGKKLFVCHAFNKDEPKQKERLEIYKDCNLFIKFLPKSATDESLKKAFEVFGTVVSARVMLEMPEGKPLGYGFVCFSNNAINGSLEIKKVFQRFYKPSDSGEGTGLGLAIIKEICRLAEFNITYTFNNQHHIFRIEFKN